MSMIAPSGGSATKSDRRQPRIGGLASRLNGPVDATNGWSRPSRTRRLRCSSRRRAGCGERGTGVVTSLWPRVSRLIVSIS